MAPSSNEWGREGALVAAKRAATAATDPTATTAAALATVSPPRLPRDRRPLATRARATRNALICARASILTLLALGWSQHYKMMSRIVLFSLIGLTAALPVAEKTAKLVAVAEGEGEVSATQSSSPSPTPSASPPPPIAGNNMCYNSQFMLWDSPPAPHTGGTPDIWHCTHVAIEPTVVRMTGSRRACVWSPRAQTAPRRT